MTKARQSPPDDDHDAGYVVKQTTSKARQEFARVLKEVREGKRFLLERHGKGVAAIVSVEDLELLETIENWHDLGDARRTLSKIAKKGTIPWEEAKKQLGFRGKS